MASEYDIVTNTQPYAEDLGLDALPPEMIQYGVRFALQSGSEFIPSLRWQTWLDAATHGEDEVKSGRATGFWVFKEAAV